MSMKEGVLTLLVTLLILPFSLPVTLDVFAKSVPGIFHVRGDWLTVFSTCIGGLQALLATFVIPCLADKLIQKKHAFTTTVNLVIGYLSPMLVVILEDQSSRITFESTLTNQQHISGEPFWGLSNVALTHNFLQVSSFCDENSPYKRAQKATNANNCRRLCTSSTEWP